MTQPTSLEEDFHVNAPGIIISGTPGDDFLHGTPDDDALLGYEGNDVLHGGDGNDNLDGGTGDDVLYGENGADLLQGGGGGDRLYGGIGQDILIGDAGIDQLFGENGDDTIDGGTGNDTLSGGNGNDVYFFGANSGQDTIYNNDNTASTDGVWLGTANSPDDITLRRHGDTLIILINGTSDSVTVTNHFFNSAETISYIEFGSSGTRWYWQDILDHVVATEEDDTLVGTLNDDVLNGLGGNDELFGYYGDDTLDGGAGNDYLAGNFGNDTYLFGVGSGQDAISNVGDSEGTERIVLGEGVTTDGVTLQRSGDHLILRINGTGDHVTVLYQFLENASIDTLEFADGTIWDADDILANVQITQFDDTIHGTTGDDVINGLAGNDDILGFAGNDTLIGRSGNDNLFGYEGNDLLQGDAGADSIYAADGDDTLQGGADNDLLAGGTGNDRLTGGAGNDWLLGGDGNDIYHFGLGSGQDRIDNGDTIDGLDRILLGPGIGEEDVTLKASGYDLVLTINGTTDQLVVSYFFFGGGNAVDGIRFEDGTYWGPARLSAEMFTGSSGNDAIDGSHANDVIRGFAGNDILTGYGGNDVLHGDSGRDILIGGSGLDAFVFDTALATINVDTIKQYSLADDVIRLDNAIFGQLGAEGALDADFFAANVGGNALDGNDYIVYDVDTGKLYYDADGNGAGAKVQFALVGTHVRVALTAGEFEVI